MQMSEFIERCQGLMKEHGDLEVEDDSGRTMDIEFYPAEDDAAACFVVT